ncbi:MAG TPA: hypothetical protein PK264_23100, partial [Hyphomicrobiaceae bacterium]|nr:hypothetical protein [Hyphomicrobiaceae bacterium]
GGGEAEASELTHLIGHRDAVKPQLTVAENLAFWQAYLTGSGSDPAGIDMALAALGLEALADVPAGFLSQGQRRR